MRVSRDTEARSQTDRAAAAALSAQSTKGARANAVALGPWTWRWSPVKGVAGRLCGMGISTLFPWLRRYHSALRGHQISPFVNVLCLEKFGSATGALGPRTLYTATGCSLPYCDDWWRRRRGGGGGSWVVGGGWKVVCGVQWVAGGR